jgi:hypothetical protein
MDAEGGTKGGGERKGGRTGSDHGGTGKTVANAATLAADLAAHRQQPDEGKERRRSVVLAGVHQAEVHTRRLGVLPAYMAVVSELEQLRAANASLESKMATMVPAGSKGGGGEDDEEEFGFPDYDSAEDAEEAIAAVAASLNEL